MKYYKIMKNITKTKKMILLAIMAVVSSVSYAATNLSLRFTVNDTVSAATNNIAIGDFTIAASSNKKISISASKKTIDGVSFTHCLKFGGTGDASGRYVSFAVEGPCTIKTYGTSSSSTSERSLTISSGNSPLGTAIKTGYCTSSSAPVAEEYNYTGGATTIYIYSSNSGYNVYGIDVTYGEGGSTETRYTVSFNANTNGTCSTSSLTEASEGAGVTLPTATANYGYNFLGWSTSSTATTASYSAGATYKPNANTTLYAIYEVDADAPVLPAAGSAITFDATKRYSEWVINSRLSDFYGNEKVMNFAKYTDDGTKTTSGKSTSLDYVPGLVAKAVLETIDYYKNNTEINVKPWFYAVQDYANNTIPSNGKNGKSFDDLNAVRNTFEKIVGKELSYREGDNITARDVLDDIFQTSLCISTRGMQGEGMFDELMAGIKRVNGFIFSEPYQIDKAIVCASKAAYLSALIKSGASEFERFGNSSQIKDWQIEQTEYNKLNKLKKTNAEAFFYWYKTCSMGLSCIQNG